MSQQFGLMTGFVKFLTHFWAFPPCSGCYGDGGEWKMEKESMLTVELWCAAVSYVINIRSVVTSLSFFLYSPYTESTWDFKSWDEVKRKKKLISQRSERERERSERMKRLTYVFKRNIFDLIMTQHVHTRLSSSE